ncbi:hypothetical protein JVU11DRAFT_6869 [Chiua virens]|nr:hypothetical protein JVU11DRAFT_6869 [Chiua virens]
MPQPTAVPSAINPSSTTEGVVPQATSLSSFPSIATTDLRSAIIAFPGGPRTVTIYPPGSRDFKPVIQDEKGDIIIVFETVRGRRKALCHEGAFYGSINVERTEIYGCEGIPLETEPVPPTSRHLGGQSSQQPQQQPSTTAIPTAELAQAKTSTSRTLRREGAFYGSIDVERATRAEIYGRGGIPLETEPVPPALRHPNGQSSQQPQQQQQRSTTDVPTAEFAQATFTNELHETLASTAAHRAPKPTKRRPLKRSGAIRDLNSVRASSLLPPSLSKGKGKQCARGDEAEDEGAEAVEELLTAPTPASPRTDRRAEEPNPSLPPVRRSQRATVKVKDKEPITAISKPVKLGASSHTAEKQKPGPVKRRKVG